MSQFTPDPRTVLPDSESPRYDVKFIGFVLFLATILAMVTYFDFVKETPDGEPQLHPYRQERLEARLKELDSATQYALKATSDGVYLCHYCRSGAIRLKANEVWKYGYTTKENRYTDYWLATRGLQFEVQYVGSVSDCMKQEQLKITNYPLLPENQARKHKLPRPPGNKVDW